MRLELQALGVTSGRKVSVSGQPVALSLEHVQTFGLALHELATNAAKYGGLSAPDGSLAVSWSAGPEGRLRILWSEDGVPDVTAPVRQGFGSRLIGDLARQFGGGAVRYDWRPHGLAAELELALD